MPIFAFKKYFLFFIELFFLCNNEFNFFQMDRRPFDNNILKVKTIKSIFKLKLILAITFIPSLQ